MNRLVKIGCTLLALGTGPLLLYVIFGPKDGNPIGLGLLFFFSFPAAMACLAIGAIQSRSAGATRGRRVPEESGDPGHWSP